MAVDETEMVFLTRKQIAWLKSLALMRITELKVNNLNDDMNVYQGAVEQLNRTKL